MVKDNEGIHPEDRRGNNAASVQERKVDIMDCEASEGVDVKQGDTGTLQNRLRIPKEGI